MIYPEGDASLIQIVDAALADAARRSGRWLLCRPGCNQCCTGVFRISMLDVARLRTGLAVLAATNPQAADALRQRIELAQARLCATFPGNASTGLLGTGEMAEAAFEEFANDEVCPVLDPETGSCSLYAYRPMTCRTFGPPVENEEGGLGVCELCFVGASPEQVAMAQVHLPPPELEAELADQTNASGESVVAFAFQFDRS